MKRCPKTRTVFAVFLNRNRGTGTTPPAYLTKNDRIIGIHMYQGEEGKEVFVKYFDVLERLDRPKKKGKR